ncbi:hypothetical protein [Rhodococcus spongiicola]|uniref:Anti-sigma-M factor RsmA n=1 Tax=Rhodococcus spongiicola TaxID=2487352 RepID=A0A3S3A5A7_9NOCA|nr:hypothetical protein [Rhodococcus spongiicola]RVW02350.1 hypothetical protein EF834_12180 [Rhodococcus spongiicola]
MTVHDGDETLGPPFSTDLLADLHAGVLPHDISTRLWPLVRQDPAALAVIDALDAVSADLGEAGRDHSLGTRVPPEIVTRINTALAQDDSRPSATVTELTEVRTRRPARTWIAVAVASTAAAVSVVFALGRMDPTGPAAPAAVATSTAGTPQPPAVDLGTDIDGGQVLALLGDADSSNADGVGRLADPESRATCLQANGIDRSVPVLGMREVRFRGSDAVLLLLPGPRPPGLTALVVGSGCDATNPDLLSRTEIG